MMKRRIMGLFLVVMLCANLLLGCNSDTKSDTDYNAANNSTTEDSTKDNGTEDSTGDISTEAGKAAEEGEDEGAVNEISYAYEQDLNFIRDNYRNYYEIFVYSFCDSDGDGIGDFKGIISKLDYINEEMGFNGIWLMPIMPSTTYHKYDVTDYYDVDQQYGTLGDFQKLIDECNKRDIKLIIDLVFNHSSAQHPWFEEAVAYLETLKEGEEPDSSACPYVEYYHFTKEDNGTGDYHRAGSSDWYYEGVFWDQMPDLALESIALRGEIEKIAKYWLDLGVDGFRLDAAKEFYTGETSKNVEVLQWFSHYVTSVKEDAYIVGEVWDESATITSYYKSGVTSFFNFPLAQYNGLITNTARKLGTGSASSFAKSIITMQEQYSASNPNYIDAPFISNHDTTRISAQCVNDENLMKMVAGMLLTLNGSPFVYYGEEIGMNSSGDRDENKRLPMQWSTSDPTGMTKGPYGADEVKQKFAPLEEQLKNPLSILNYYKRAIRIRNENPEIARGTMTMIEALTSREVCAFDKDYEGSEIVIVYNINKEATTVDLKMASYEKLNIRGYLTVDGTEVTLANGVLNMPFYSIVILK